MNYKDLVFKLEVKENGYYVLSGDRYYKVNENTFNILKSFSEGRPIEQLAVDYRIEKDEIEKILSVLDDKRPMQNKVGKLFILIPAVINNFIGRILRYTGNTKLFIVIALFFALFVTHYLFAGGFKLLYASLGIIDYLSVLFIVILIHEYGHIAMAYRRGLKGLNIYVGFYLIFPIFYSKISELVTLKFKNRLLVDFGGIYFQMIAFVISYSLYLYYNSETTQLFSTINLIIMLINLIPFSFTDGYWLYADLVEVDNLNDKATKLITNVIRLKFAEKQPLSVVFYATFRTMVFIAIMTYVVCFLVEQSQYISDIFYQLKESNWNILVILRCILLLLPFFLFILYLIKKIRYGIAKYLGRNP